LVAAGLDCAVTRRGDLRMRRSHVKMSGRPTHYYRGEFEIVRLDGEELGLSSSRYCYELRFKDRAIARFEFQDDARTVFDSIFNEWTEIMRRRKVEEATFAQKHKLPSFPTQFDA
jgi:hypothetical protein